MSEPQAKAIITWCARKDEASILRAIAQPTLIVHGSDDSMFPSINAYNMFKAMRMRSSSCIPTPDTAHLSNTRICS